MEHSGHGDASSVSIPGMHGQATAESEHALRCTGDASSLCLLRLLAWPAAAVKVVASCHGSVAGLVPPAPQHPPRDSSTAHGGMLSPAWSGKQGKSRGSLSPEVAVMQRWQGGRRGCRGRGGRLLCKQQLLFPPFQQLIRI